MSLINVQLKSGYRFHSIKEIEHEIRNLDGIVGIVDKIRDDLFIQPRANKIDIPSISFEMWAIYYFGDVSTENRIRSLMMKEKLDLLGPCVSHLQTIIENIDSIINIINDLQLLTSKRAQTKVKTDELPVWVHSQLGQPGYDASPDTLLGLIALEQLQLSRRQVYVRLCVRCGRVFDTKNGNAKFCSNPACKECPLNTIYDARSIAYQKWITDQKRSDLSCFGEDAAKVKEELDYYYDCWEQRAKDTIKESFVGLYIILAKFSFCLSAAKGCILYLYLKYF